MRGDFDFIAIGDTVTDAFIRLKDPSAHIDIDRGAREICMRFAEKIPYEDVTVVPAVGNSANAVVAASRLGLRSALVSNIGDDYFGEECLTTLKEEKVATDFVTAHKGQKTNYHYVLWYEDDRTILIKHEEYDYKLPDMSSPRWVYLSSLGGNSESLHQQVEQYLDQRPGVKLAFQPGTFQIKMGKDALRRIYERSEVFICNKEEAQRILGADEPDVNPVRTGASRPDDGGIPPSSATSVGTADRSRRRSNGVKKLLTIMHGLGPKIVVITDGPKGAYASDGNSAWFMPSYPDPKPPYERTGAGDAFSATFVAALALDKDIREALRWAPINAMSVVQQVGARAGLLNRSQLEEYLGKAPEDYKPESI